YQCSSLGRSFDQAGQTSFTGEGCEEREDWKSGEGCEGREIERGETRERGQQGKGECRKDKEAELAPDVFGAAVETAKIDTSHEETKNAKDGSERISSGFLRALHFFVV